MRRLAQLADLMAAGTPQRSEAAPAATVGVSPTSEQATCDLVAAWSSDTLARARQLGLAPKHLEPRVELASLRQYAWNPLSDESRHSAIKQVPLPPGSHSGLRARIEVLII